MADLGCHPTVMALSQGIKFSRGKYRICFREFSLIEMAYMHGFLSSPPWEFSAFLSHVSKKIYVPSMQLYLQISNYLLINKQNKWDLFYNTGMTSSQLFHCKYVSL